MLYMQIMIPHTENTRNLPNNSDFQAFTSNNYLAKPKFQQKKESCEIHNRIFFAFFKILFFVYFISKVCVPLLYFITYN